MSILADIFAHKRGELESLRARTSLHTLKALAAETPEPPAFIAALKVTRAFNGSPALISEIKRRSPSRGSLAEIPDPLELAELYASQGAAAISVLTDEKYFGGSLEDLRQVTNRLLNVPLLRKDFICDPYQLYEARSAGASAVLLIAAALEKSELQALHTLALDIGLTPLVEVHSPGELEIALTCSPRLVGINNRNLHDFSVRLETTFELRPLLPEGVTVVAESGIHTAADVEALAAYGVDAILVGEALVTSSDIAGKTRELAGIRNQTLIDHKTLKVSDALRVSRGS